MPSMGAPVVGLVFGRLGVCGLYIGGLVTGGLVWTRPGMIIGVPTGTGGFSPYRPLALEISLQGDPKRRPME